MRELFKNVASRFSHVDAKFVSCQWGGDGKFYYRVLLYPYWEHPLYLQALESGASFGFNDYSEGKKQVTIYPIEPLTCYLHASPPGSDVTDFYCSSKHPILWQYESKGQIFCNSRVDFSELRTRLVESIPEIPDSYLGNILNTVDSYMPPFSLGPFPLTLYKVLTEILAKMKVKVLHGGPPTSGSTPKVFFFDDEYMIAKDFEIEYPIFEHKNSWFRVT